MSANVSSRGLPLIETAEIECGYLDLIVKYCTYEREEDIGYPGGVEIQEASINGVLIPLTQSQLDSIEDYLRE
jgi:hypothetical protein